MDSLFLNIRGRKVDEPVLSAKLLDAAAVRPALEAYQFGDQAAVTIQDVGRRTGRQEAGGREASDGG